MAAVVKENKNVRRARRIHALWEKQRDRAKLLWVVSVLAFWITVAIMATVYFLEKRLDLILISVALGMMILGLWLKTRFQLIARKEPPRPETPADPPDGEDHQSGA
jgi:predicted membrane protein